MKNTNSATVKQQPSYVSHFLGYYRTAIIPKQHLCFWLTLMNMD